MKLKCSSLSGVPFDRSLRNVKSRISLFKRHFYQGKQEGERERESHLHIPREFQNTVLQGYVKCHIFLFQDLC